MFNPTETDERHYLDAVLEQLRLAQQAADDKIKGYEQKIIDTKKYIWENMAELDSAERAANRISVYEDVTLGTKTQMERDQLQKLILSPYFGRIDFATAEDAEQPFYLGIHAFYDLLTVENVIFDWRAPVSSMFYDFETGDAYYDTPSGRIAGEMRLKRQYRIKNSTMEFMIESAVNIGDDILQKELSQHSDEKMKNIVATIQREQNAIIRNETAQVLVLQGAAGSGKTSIALHRVAFLLYRYKDVLTSGNILILSPNRVFGNYISNVLPELGEENILEMGFGDLADKILGSKYKRQTFSQQVEQLMETEDEDEIARIAFKATVAFAQRLTAFLKHGEETFFCPTEITLDGLRLSPEMLWARYRKLSRFPILERLKKMGADILVLYERTYERRPAPILGRNVRSALSKMFLFSDSMSLYREFYRYIGHENFFAVPKKQQSLAFCDVFPYLYVKLFLEGTTRDYKNIKHLLVDEMQDYTPIQYAVLSKLFACRMTILGDSNQSVNPYSSSSTEKIRPFFGGCVCMELHKSYRSTLEIIAVAQMVQQNKNLVPVERHGEQPRVLENTDDEEELASIRTLIAQFRTSAFATLGVLCKSQQEANDLYQLVRGTTHDVFLLDANSTEFREGIVIATIYMSKGLEFDQVIVPGVSAHQYKTPLDRSLLYIACTRAMHKLDLTCVGGKTPFLKTHCPT